MKTGKNPNTELKPEDTLLEDAAHAGPENGGIPAPEAGEGDGGGIPAPHPPEEAEKTVPVLLRHKTGYAKYRRAGIVLSQKPEAYQVTVSQLEKLRSDPWVVIEKGPAPK